MENLVDQQSTEGSPLYHHYLSPAQFRSAYGPAAADLSAAESTLKAQGFTTERTSSGVYISGAQATFESAFGVKLLSRGASAASLVPDRALALPQSLARANASVVGFTRSRGYFPQSHRVEGAVADNRHALNGPYWFTDLKQAYEYPSYKTATGAGRTIGIVGFQDFADSDVALYFNHEGISPPAIIRRPVAGGPAPAGGVDSGLTDELTLDIAMAGGSAPGATIVTYEGPTPPGGGGVPDETFITPFIAAIEDNAVDILSTSFGGCELYYTAAYNGGTDFTGILKTFHQLFLQGNSQGMTFIFSSGDAGAYECTDPNFTVASVGVSTYADDPNVTGVGGSTVLETTYPPSAAHPLRSEYVAESSYDQQWNPSTSGQLPGSIWGSGGGVSTIWNKPGYQRLVSTGAPKRAVPDLSMHMGAFRCTDTRIVNTPACHNGSSDYLFVGGGLYAFVGTSASAPEFAGLLALQEQLFGTRLGNANNLIYALGATPALDVYHRNVPGNNGYPSKGGYDLVTGLGTVRGAAFVLRGSGPLAGDPQTPSNP